MINKVILIGNAGAEPEVRTLESGTKVARLRLATTEKIYNRATQETKEHTEWHSVSLWSGLADVADKFIRKGSRVYIEGSIRSNEWTDKEGGKHYGIEIVARDMKMLDRRPTDELSVPWASPVSSTSSSASVPDAPAPADDPDDLPF